MRKSIVLTSSETAALEGYVARETARRTNSRWTRKLSQRDQELFVMGLRHEAREAKKSSKAFWGGKKLKIGTVKVQILEEGNVDAIVFGDEYIAVRAEEPREALADLHGHGSADWADMMLDPLITGFNKAVDMQVVARGFNPRVMLRKPKAPRPIVTPSESWTVYVHGVTEAPAPIAASVVTAPSAAPTINPTPVEEPWYEWELETTAFDRYMARVNWGNPDHFATPAELFAWCDRYPGLTTKVKATLDRIKAEVTAEIKARNGQILMAS